MNAQLTWGTYLETCWAFADGTFLPYMSLFLKKLAVRTKCKSIKVMDQGDWKTDLLSLDPSSPERPAEQSPQNLKQRSFLWRLMHSHGHKTTVFVMWKYHVRLWAMKWRWTSVDTYPNSYIILEWERLLTKHIWRGRLFERGSAYWKEGAKSNHCFGGHLDG